MITVSTTTAMMLYLCLTLVVLLGLWTYQHYRLRTKKIEITEQELFVCEYCLFVYLEEKTKNVTQCPQCQSYNKNNNYIPRE